MSISYLAAKDEIFGIANSAFVAFVQSLNLGYEMSLFFPGDESDVPDPTQLYAECSYAVVVEKQVSLSSVNGTKIYESIGLFTLQVYAPKSQVESYRQAETIASVVRDAFRQPSPSGEVWFSNQRATPAGGNATKNQINVVVTCKYQTVK